MHKEEIRLGDLQLSEQADLLFNVDVERDECARVFNCLAPRKFCGGAFV